MATLDLEEVWMVTKRLSPVSAEELDALAGSLGGALEEGHRAFLTRFGVGSFVGVLRVLAPAAILEQRDLVRKHGVFSAALVKCWTNFSDYFEPADGGRLVPVALSIDGDMLALHLDVPSMFFVFPRARDKIAATDTFEQALAWFSDSGAYWPRSRKPWFESHVGRVEHVITIAGAAHDPHEAVGHLLEELPPDHEGVDSNPCDDLFYRDADAIVQWTGEPGFRLRADESSHEPLLARLVAALERGGWHATTKRQSTPFL